MPFDTGPPTAPSDGRRLLWAEVCIQSILGKKYLVAPKQFKQKELKQMILDVQKATARLWEKNITVNDYLLQKKKLEIDIKRYRQDKLRHAKKIIEKYPAWYKALYKETRRKFKN